jgi:hypothetical protein
MKDIVILVLVVIVAFLVWNSRVNLSGYSATPVGQKSTAPVSPDIIQAIIEKVQQSKPDEYPLETLFVTPQADGSYATRFMFFNTRKFSGAQYDIKAKIGTDGSVELMNVDPTSAIDLTTAYKPDTYKPYADVQSNTSSQLASVIASRPETPVNTDLRLNTRS